MAGYCRGLPCGHRRYRARPGAATRILDLPASEISLSRGLFGSHRLLTFFLRCTRCGFAAKLRRNEIILLFSGLVLAGNRVLLFGFEAAACHAGLIILDTFVAGMDGLETTPPQLVLAYGVVPTGLGFLMSFPGAQGLTTQRIALPGYLDPMVTLAILLLVFSERPALLPSPGASGIAGAIPFATLAPGRAGGSGA